MQTVDMQRKTLLISQNTSFFHLASVSDAWVGYHFQEMIILPIHYFRANGKIPRAPALRRALGGMRCAHAESWIAWLIDQLTMDKCEINAKAVRGFGIFQSRSPHNAPWPFSHSRVQGVHAFQDEAESRIQGLPRETYQK
jgi:hypothetical protein